MLVGKLQSLLEGIYALDLSYDVRDFLITDAALAKSLDSGGRRMHEKLLIAESSDEAEVCLYLERDLVERLEHNDPVCRLSHANLADFWTVFEGVSHFAYYAWNAAADKTITLLEMELQAEVDKFVATTLLLQRQGERAPPSLHHWLFDLPTFGDGMSRAELERYRCANHYAGKYCKRLRSTLSRGFAAPDVSRELRRFYRFSQPAKIGHIDAQ